MKALHTAGLLACGLAATTLANDKSTLSLTLENDSFLGSDCYYTQGARLQYMLKPNDVPSWTDKALKEIPTLGMDVNRTRIGFALGQEIFTPRYIGRTALQPKDRPYGAWLHGSFIARRSGKVADHIMALDEFEVDLGIVGPEALGEETQSTWHKAVGEAEPRGWENQLETEPAFQTYLTRSYEIGHQTENYWGFGFIPHVRAALGNVYVFGEAGTMFRAGYNMPIENVVSPIESFSTHPSHNPPNFAAYLFAGADGRVVGHNLFLDGNTFRHSHSVEKELFVADFRAGGALRYGPIEGVVSVVHRTKEFTAQKRDEDFMSITLQYHF